MTEEQIKLECEWRFQNGGPKINIYDSTSMALRPTFWCVKIVKQLWITKDCEIWARRKVCGENKYIWKIVSLT